MLVEIRILKHSFRLFFSVFSDFKSNFFRQEQSSILTSLFATLTAIKKEKDPDSSLVEEKAAIVKRLLAEVELGVEEAVMMAQLASHLSSLEGDRAKLKAQVRFFGGINGVFLGFFGVENDSSCFLE